MEYVYSALILNETGEEINEENITAMLEAAGVDVVESRVKALIAALEGVDIDEAVAQAAAVPAASGAAPAAGEVEEADEAVEETTDVPDTTDDDEDEEASGEGLGELFG